MMKLDLEGQELQPTCSCLEVLKKLQWLDLEVDIMVLCPFIRGRFILWLGLGFWFRWKCICYVWKNSTCLERVIIRICHG